MANLWTSSPFVIGPYMEGVEAEDKRMAVRSTATGGVVLRTMTSMTNPKRVPKGQIRVLLAEDGDRANATWVVMSMDEYAKLETKLD